MQLEGCGCSHVLILKGNLKSYFIYIDKNNFKNQVKNIFDKNNSIQFF
jgi:hypothetical protein